MRPLLLSCLCLALTAGEASALPASTQRLVDDSAAIAAKAKQAFDQAVAKEQAKLSAALQKEQEKETRKGNLEGALAIKALIAEVEGGLLQQRAAAQGDLLGDASMPSKAAPAISGAPASLVTDCPLPTQSARFDVPPEDLAAFLERSIALRLPQGDPKRYQFSATTPGPVVAVTSSRPRFAEVRADLERSGFRRVEGGDPEFAWYILMVKTGDRFSATGPGDGWFATHILAAGIKQVR